MFFLNTEKMSSWMALYRTHFWSPGWKPQTTDYWDAFHISSLFQWNRIVLFYKMDTTADVKEKLNRTINKWVLRRSYWWLPLAYICQYLHWHKHSLFKCTNTLNSYKNNLTTDQSSVYHIFLAQIIYYFCIPQVYCNVSFSLALFFSQGTFQQNFDLS